MDIRDIIRTIKKVEVECNANMVKVRTETEPQDQSTVDYEKFYNKIMAIVELADEVTRPHGGMVMG